jgi:hypothetical protein
MKVQPEPPFRLLVLRDVESVEMADNVLEGGWVIVLELDDFLLAFLYTCVSFCFAESSCCETYGEVAL